MVSTDQEIKEVNNMHQQDIFLLRLIKLQELYFHNLMIMF
jgi:hypothetical protein